MRWSKLQREIYNLVSDDIDLQIHCAIYPMDSRFGSTGLPRYWITLDREILFDYPRQFVSPNGTVTNLTGFHAHYPYGTDMSAISDLLREYIDTPKEALLAKTFSSDHWGLVNILRAADRRIGKRQLERLQKKTHNKAALRVIAARLAATLPAQDIRYRSTLLRKTHRRTWRRQRRGLKASWIGCGKKEPDDLASPCHRLVVAHEADIRRK